MSAQNANPYFLAMVQQHELIGMLGLGKIADPASGETKVELEKVQYAIGTLEMLEQKTRGHLVETEQQVLRRVLTTLRLNFVEAAEGQGSESQATQNETESRDADAPEEEQERGEEDESKE